MGIIDRLGDVIRSYLAEEVEGPWEEKHRPGAFEDPDMEAAFEELDAYMQRKSSPRDGAASSAGQFRPQNPGKAFQRPEPSVPEALRADFEELGVPFGASSEECKVAYKKLLKIHHPDRHAGHPENIQKATEKSARLNTAFDRIETWRQTGKT
jgi:DnaJ-class molecular chaperone